MLVPPSSTSAAPGPGPRPVAARSGRRKRAVAAGDSPLLPCFVQDWEKGSAILGPEPKVPCSRGAKWVEVAALAWIWEESAAPGPASLGSE